jgi:hypothetical protein
VSHTCETCLSSLGESTDYRRMIVLRLDSVHLHPVPGKKCKNYYYMHKIKHNSWKCHNDMELILFDLQYRDCFYSFHIQAIARVGLSSESGNSFLLQCNHGLI